MQDIYCCTVEAKEEAAKTALRIIDISLQHGCSSSIGVSVDTPHGNTLWNIAIERNSNQPNEAWEALKESVKNALVPTKREEADELADQLSKKHSLCKPMFLYELDGYYVYSLDDEVILEIYLDTNEKKYQFYGYHSIDEDNLS